MNDMVKIVRGSVADRLGLFKEAASRLSCVPENVEKDFWVCWTLDTLYNKTGLKTRLLFKGGTALSKVFGLIRRFSEDVDITVFRNDLDGLAFPSDADFNALGRKPRERHLDLLKSACQSFIAGPFKGALERVAAADLNGMPFKFEADPDDPDGQTLLFHYPSVFPGAAHDYIRRVVKIESGARSALDPNHMSVVRPYIADDLPDFCLDIGNVRTIAPERTFWDKMIILHGQRRWFENRGEPYKNGDRVSRHYYDVYSMLSTDFGQEALADLAMAEDCARHARTFFNRVPYDLDSASPGTFALTPPVGMLPYVEADYRKMVGMVFGVAPPFSDVIEAVSAAEATLNSMALAPVGA